MIFPWALPKATLSMAVGQMWGEGAVCFPWALPKAMLSMAVGQLWCGVAVCFSLGVAQGYVEYGRWPIVVLVGVAVFLGRCPRLSCVWPLANSGVWWRVFLWCFDWQS